MTRLLRLTFPVLMVLAGACDDDGSAPADAGRDMRRDGNTACTMADCMAIPRPNLGCTPPTVATFTCVRTDDLRCIWGHERCSPGVDGGTADAAADAGDAAGDAADDAPAGS